MVPTVHFFFLFNFGTTLSLLSSFNRELISKGIRRTSIGRESFILFNMSWDPNFYYWVPLVLTGRFARKFGHHTARQNTAQRGKKSTFGWRVSVTKRLLSSLLKCWIISTCRTLYLLFFFSHLISQTCFKGKALEFVSSCSRASSFPQGFLHLFKGT